ncbi:MAG: phage head-tail connector protein [Gemmatimonadales bacterium]|nr:phage head-tail connector protein [Gemmatimonadales bacterium]
MSVRLVTPPAVEPVDLESLKRHLRVEHNEDDELIATLGQAAREFGETYTRRAWMTQTWERVIDTFPWSALSLPYPPVQSIESVTYVDRNGATQTWAADQYTLDLAGDGGFGRLYPVFGGVYPTDLRWHPGGVVVRFVAGYGDVPETLADPLAASVPAAGRAALKLIVGHLYAHREESVVGTIISTIPFSARTLLATMRLDGGCY